MCKDNPNMVLYEQFRDCPKEAKRAIAAGRLKGKTDINPMWRIKRLTEVFGPCGFGWVSKIERTWIEEGSGGERTANVEITLRVKYAGEWSEPIYGIGGSALVAKESGGLYTDDECYKKAYTDALSVACKALGIAADVYFERDPDSKYPSGDDQRTKGENAPGAGAQGAQGAPKAPNTPSKYQIIKELVNGKASIDLNKVDEWIRAKWGKTIRINELTDEQFAQLRAAVEGAK